MKDEPKPSSNQVPLFVSHTLTSDTKPEKVFGKIDAMKLRSCMTLFANVSSEDERIVEALARYFGSERCQLTLDIINNSPKARRMYISR
uniref:DUF1810 family protein n=1 Tax=Limnohabitans sp. TaxID=1907725 RepID=UPI0040478471